MVGRWTDARISKIMGCFSQDSTESFVVVSFFLRLDEGAATNSKTIRFVFQSLVSCWLLNRNSTPCWFFIVVFFGFWPWKNRRVVYDLKATFRIGSNDDADDGWLVSYLVYSVCVFPWIRQNNLCIVMKRNWALFVPLVQGFSILTHNPHGFFVCFHIVPRNFAWFCK